ncbi:YDG domain-containing protein At5g47150 [Linum grandiflorum]
MLPPPPPHCQHSPIPAAAIPSRLIAWCLSSLDLVTTASNQKQQAEDPLFFRSQGGGGGSGTEPIRIGAPPKQALTVSDDNHLLTDDSTNNNNLVPFKDKKVVVLPFQYPPRRILNGIREFPLGCGPAPTVLAPSRENTMRKKRRISSISAVRKIADENNKSSIIVNDDNCRLADHVSPRFVPDSREHERARVEVKNACQLFDKTLVSFRAIFALEKGRKKNAHSAAAQKLKRMGRWVNKEPRVGHVPGIEIGDAFRSRAEMVVIGLHREFIRGIDTINKGGDLLAACVAATDRYLDNDMELKDTLWYSGEGGNPNVSQGVAVQDQKLEGGNYALWNSMKKKAPVRVIRKKFVLRQPRYVYDGLYLVMDFTESKGVKGNLVFKFRLMKIKNQTPRGPQQLIGNYSKGDEAKSLAKPNYEIKEIVKGEDNKLDGCINRVTQMRNYTRKFWNRPLKVNQFRSKI